MKKRKIKEKVCNNSGEKEIEWSAEGFPLHINKQNTVLINLIWTLDND